LTDTFADLQFLVPCAPQKQISKDLEMEKKSHFAHYKIVMFDLSCCEARNEFYSKWHPQLWSVTQYNLCRGLCKNAI